LDNEVFLRRVCHSERNTVKKPRDTQKPPDTRLPQNVDIELEESNFVHTLDKKRNGKLRGQSHIERGSRFIASFLLSFWNKTPRSLLAKLS